MSWCAETIGVLFHLLHVSFYCLRPEVVNEGCFDVVQSRYSKAIPYYVPAVGVSNYLSFYNGIVLQ